MLPKISRLLILLVLLILISLGSQGETTGQALKRSMFIPIVSNFHADWIGPYGGTIVTIAVDPSNSQVVYAGTFGSGVYKSTDRGHNWYSISTGLTNLNIYSLAVDSTNPSTLYAGTYRSQVFKSNDGGNSWNWSGAGMQDQAIVYSLAVDPVTPSNVYATTRGISNNGNPPWKGVLYNSTNAGQTWSPSLYNVGTTQDWAYSLAINPNNHEQVFAALHENGPYMKDSQGWHWLPDGIGDYSGRSIVISPQPLYSSWLYFGVWHRDAIYKTQNSGSTWSGANTGLIPLDPMVYTLALDPINPNTVYMGTFNLGVMKTTTAGASWQATGLSSEKLYSLVINPTLTNNLFAGTSGDGLFRSDDNSGSWLRSDYGIDNAMVTSVINNPNNPDQLYSSVYGAGIYQSSNQGKLWNELNTGLTDKYVHDLVMDPANTNVLYALTDAGGLFKNNLSNGNGWISAGLGLPLTNFPLSAFSENDPFATLDDKENFAASQGLEAIPLATNAGLLKMVFAPSNAQVAYIGTVGKGLYRSTDGAASWQPIGLSGNNVLSLAVDPFNSNLLYATVNFFGNVMYSTDGGGSWNDAIRPSNSYAVATSPFESAKVYVGTDNGLYSYQYQTNAWTPLGLQGQIVTAVAADPTHPGVLYAGTTNGGYSSLDSGSNWTYIDNRLADQTITSISFNKIKPGLIYFSTKTHGILLAAFRF